MSHHTHYHCYQPPTRADGAETECLLWQYHEEPFSEAYTKSPIGVPDHPGLPDEARDAVLLHFWRTHTRDIIPVVQGYNRLSKTLCRVELFYIWKGSRFRPRYDYVVHESGHTSVYRIVKFHDGEPCYGGFCPNCGH